jgi:RNA polymerase-binding transcription factor DksA
VRVVEDRDETAVDAEPGTPDEGPVMTLDQVAEDLDAVDAALGRLDSGTYGRCAVCDATIDDAVLVSRPTAVTCPDHDAPI